MDKKCNWKYCGLGDYHIWKTECGGEVAFDNAAKPTGKINDCKFCPYCAKKINDTGSGKKCPA